MPEKKYGCRHCMNTGKVEVVEGKFVKCKHCKGRGWNFASEIPKTPLTVNGVPVEEPIVALEAEAAAKVELLADPEEAARAARREAHAAARAKGSKKAKPRKRSRTKKAKK